MMCWTVYSKYLIEPLFPGSSLPELIGNMINTLIGVCIPFLLILCLCILQDIAEVQSYWNNGKEALEAYERRGKV